MEGKKPVEQAKESKPATEAQIGLIQALYEETNYVRGWPKEGLAMLTREQANKHINYLKESKVRDQQLRSQNQKASNFDKIAFGLCYKLTWRELVDSKRVVKPTKQEFINIMVEEYKLFKEAQKACRAEVEEGGHQ